MRIFLSPPLQDIQKLKELFSIFDPLCDGYHIDIMDGTFVPQTMGSIDLTNQIAQATKKPLWVHLMVSDPQTYFKKLTLSAGSIVSFHYEAVAHNQIEEYAEQLEHMNLVPSLAINPKTSAKKVAPLAHYFEHFLIMSVEPGQAGQTFLPKTYGKLKKLMVYKTVHELSLTLSVDGGITTNNISRLKRLGVAIIATTSAVFNQPEPLLALKKLQKSAQK